MHEFLNAQNLSVAGLGNVLKDSLSKAFNFLKGWFTQENVFTRYLSGAQQVFDTAFNELRLKVSRNPVVAIAVILGAIVIALVLGPALVGRTIASTLKGMGRAVGGFFGGIKAALRGAVRS